jgi:hypothetical protein
VVALEPDNPEVYQDLWEVFSKTQATCLPPYCLWDCTIDLLECSAPPLLVAEIEAMEEYIQEALQQGFDHSSTFPASAGFFFVTKNDGGQFHHH